MAIDNHLSAGFRPLVWALQRPDSYGEETLTGTTQLTAKSSQFLRLDPGGAGRNVDLPGPDEGLEDNNGRQYMIVNTADAAENLTVRDPDGSTVAVVSQNERCIFIGTGAKAWQHLGIESIALA